MRNRLVVVTVLVAMLAAGGHAAGALTTWKGFGSASVNGRGYWGYPGVAVQSATKKGPDDVRFVVSTTSSEPVEVSIYWALHCWKGENDYATRTGDMDKKVTKAGSFTKTITNLPKGDPDYCALYVEVFSLDKANIKVSLQSRY